MTWDQRLFHWHLKTRRFGRELIYLEETGSTNRWMLENQERFTLSGGVVVAGHQTAGRGRADRIWWDRPDQSLLFSILLRQYGGDRYLGLLSLLPAVALGEYLRDDMGTTDRLELKWPNDVMANGKKISGVLGQTGGSPPSKLLVLGMGVNVNGPIENLPEPVRRSASTIEAETSRKLQREVLLAELLKRTEQLHDEMLDGQIDAIRHRWLLLGPRLGSPITRKQGDAVMTGTFAGLGQSGELLLRDAHGQTQVLLSGDIEHQ